MPSSMTSVFICVAAIWLTQRLLTIRQAMRFRKQLVDLRAQGRTSVGLAKALGRRVYVGLAFDTGGTVTAALVLRGVTVFADGRQQPALIGCTVGDLATGRTPAGLPPLVAKASTQSAEFIAASLRRSADHTVSAHVASLARATTLR